MVCNACIYASLTEDDAAEGQPEGGCCGRRRGSTEDAAFDGGVRSRHTHTHRAFFSAPCSRDRKHFALSHGPFGLYDCLIKPEACLHRREWMEDEAAAGQPEGGWCGRRRGSTEDTAPDEGEGESEKEKHVVISLIRGFS